jgi:hypothetical protein
MTCSMLPVLLHCVRRSSIGLAGGQPDPCCRAEDSGRTKTKLELISEKLASYPVLAVEDGSTPSSRLWGMPGRGMSCRVFSLGNRPDCDADGIGVRMREQQRGMEIKRAAVGQLAPRTFLPLRRCNLTAASPSSAWL